MLLAQHLHIQFFSGPTFLSSVFYTMFGAGSPLDRHKDGISYCEVVKSIVTLLIFGYFF